MPYNHFDTATGMAGDASKSLQSLNLFDPNTLQQLQGMFQPLFNQQQESLTRGFMGTRNALTSEAGQNAGAVAAFKGYDPSSYVGNAQSRTNSMLTPQFFQAISGLKGDQLQALLNAVGQSNEFKAANLQNAANINLGQASQYFNRDQSNIDQSNQPGFFDYLGAGLFGLGGAFLGGPAGAGIGAGLFGNSNVTTSLDPITGMYRTK